MRSETKPFYSLNIDEALQKANTSTQGLSSQEVTSRLERFGKNVLEEKKFSVFKVLLRQFHNVLIYILFIASLVSLLLGEWNDFMVINTMILINGLIGFFQELKAEASIAALRKLTESKNEVKRDNRFVSVASSDLVVGDYVILYEGEAITADMRLIDAEGLHVDESSLTGESVPVIKDPHAILPENSLPFDLKNMLLSGTSVVRGSGHAIVTQTGSDTYLASIAKKAEERAPDSPLTKALKVFSKRYAILLIAIFLMMGIIGGLQGRSLTDLGYILLAGLVSVVPEGLPIVITLVMIVGALALSKKQTLIRYLPSVETLGSVTVIACDKTGTITQGKLAVQQTNANDFQTLRRIAALCNDADETSGDPLDRALLHWVKDWEELQKGYPRLWSYPFDTHKRLMATVNRIEDKELMQIKGAYEVLKEKSDNPNEFDAPFQHFLAQGLRVIALGEAPWNQNEDPSSWKIHLVGLIGFLDPPKEGVKEAVFASKQANVHVLMITGDHPETAKAVAREVGIWKEGDPILIGKELEELSDERLRESLQKATVIARILPEHKYRIVKLLQGAQELVAVTGDGVNDVPALRAADIGIAMGGGTEAAKSASEMVITDNNLSVIVHAIRNARVIADNIRKVIYYLLATSFQEVVLVFLSIVSFLPLPLYAIQILWINIVTDGVFDKTFPFDKEEGNVMARAPRKPEKQFLDRAQIGRILYFGTAMGLFTFFLYFLLLDIYSQKECSSIIFTSVVVAQWANALQSKKELEPFFYNLRRSFTVNPWVYPALFVGILLQCIVLYLVPDFFHSTPLTASQWKYPAIVFLSSFFLVEIRKWITWRKAHVESLS